MDSYTGFLSDVKEMLPGRLGRFLSSHASKKWQPAARDVRMMAMKTGLDRMWGRSGKSDISPGRLPLNVRMQKWAIRNSRISNTRIPNTTNTVSMTPDHLSLKFTFGKKYLAARAPGRNMDPMNKASRNRYPKLQRQTATNKMETIQ